MCLIVEESPPTCSLFIQFPSVVFYLTLNKFHHSARRFLVSVYFVALCFIVLIANI